MNKQSRNGIQRENLSHNNVIEKNQVYINNNPKKS